MEGIFGNLAIGFIEVFKLQAVTLAGITMTLPFNILMCLIGVILGTLIGVLPGIGPVATIAMLLPFTFTLSPIPALIMLAGIYYGAQYGGSTTAILVNLPGETSSVVTALDEAYTDGTLRDQLEQHVAIGAVETGFALEERAGARITGPQRGAQPGEVEPDQQVGEWSFGQGIGRLTGRSLGMLAIARMASGARAVECREAGSDVGGACGQLAGALRERAPARETSPMR